MRARALLDEISARDGDAISDTTNSAVADSVDNQSITRLARPLIEELDQFCKRADVVASVRDARSTAMRQLQAEPDAVRCRSRWI